MTIKRLLEILAQSTDLEDLKIRVQMEESKIRVWRVRGNVL